MLSGYFAIAQQRHLHFLDLAIQHRSAFFAHFGIARKKHEAYTILPESRKFKSQLAAFAIKKFVRYLYENAGTVTGVRFTTTGTAVCHTFEHGECIRNNLM